MSGPMNVVLVIRIIILSMWTTVVSSGTLTVRLSDGAETTMTATSRAEPSQKRYNELEDISGGPGVLIKEEGIIENADKTEEGDPNRALSCIAWRGVQGCSPETAGEGSGGPALLLPCDAFVSSHLAGWCECEAGFRAKEVGCVHASFSCAEECAKFTAEDAAWPTEANRLRAELAPTDTVVAEFLHGPPEFAFEFGRAHIMEALAKNLPFAIFLLCDCDEDIRWGSALEELVRLPEYKEHNLKARFAFGFARRDGIESFGLLDNFAVEGPPALGIDNIPVGQNMEKYTFRMSEGGQLKHRQDIGQAPPVAVTGIELADFFLSFLNGSLPLTTKTAPAPPLTPKQQLEQQRQSFRGHQREQQQKQRRLGEGQHPWGQQQDVPGSEEGDAAVSASGGGSGSGTDSSRSDSAGFKSEAVVLVGSTFRSTVLDETKDVAVLFFAPWCPACKLVEPVIDAAAGRVREVLAQQKQQNHNRQRSFDTDRNERRAEGTLQSESANADEEDDDGNDIIVAKMDLTQNDIPIRGISVHHYPSVWLWPRGQKGAPLDFSLYNHEREDAGTTEGPHSHYELGMLVDFITHVDHDVRPVHTDGGVFDHLYDA